MAKKKAINNKFYNIDYISLEKLSKAPKDKMIVCEIIGDVTEGKEEHLKKIFQEVYKDKYENKITVLVANKDLKLAEENVKKIGLYLTYDKYTYVKHELQDGCLYSGWKTGIRTKITAKDLPDSFVYLMNYKKHGYLDTAGVVDIVYKPSPFHNHTFKDDFLFISYSKSLVGMSSDKLFEECNEYVFGNDIIDVIFGIERNSPNLKDIVEKIKKAMVEQYNLYIDEMSEWEHFHDKKIERLEDIRS